MYSNQWSNGSEQAAHRKANRTKKNKKMMTYGMMYVSGSSHRAVIHKNKSKVNLSVCEYTRQLMRG